MKSNHNHIQREQNEMNRLMRNFDPKASKEARADVLQELQWQKEKFLALERIRHRNQQRERGREP